MSKEPKAENQRPLPKMGLADAMLAMDEPPTEMDKILELILDPKHLGNFTELSKAEIHVFSVLGSLAKRHHLEALSDFLGENLTLRISHKRKGRGELIKMVSRQLAIAEQQNEAEMSRPRRFFGGRR